jgi:4-hydroxy-3-methylbut-2-enyl diphosphate reductase
MSGSQRTTPPAARRPLLLAPLRIEAAAARLGVKGRARVERIGMGPAHAGATCARLTRELSEEQVPAVALVGLAAGLAEQDRAGDVVIATELTALGTARQPWRLDAALSDRLRAELAPVAGGRIRCGPVTSARALALASRLAADLEVAVAGALACDMESAWLAPLAESCPCFAVVRVIVDHPGRPLFGPWTVPGGMTALRRLTAIAAALARVLGVDADAPAGSLMTS